MIKGTTTFPVTHVDVAALTTREFAFAVERHDEPTIDEVCRKFAGDANRALVWMIRYRALRSWCDRAPAAPGGPTLRDICDVAAVFELNEAWEFDVVPFGAAVDEAARRRDGGHATRFIAD